MHRAAALATSVALAAATCLASAAPAGAVGHRLTFSYTGGPQAFTVPAGVTAITVEACGALGSGTDPILGFAGGRGGRARSALEVAPGEVLRIRVGGDGTVGGWNGGGGSSVGVGGGASDVRQGGDALADRVVVGGGGGGAGLYSSIPMTFLLAGGGGGGLQGDSGQGSGGAAGTQTGPGSGGALGTGGAGSGPGGGGGGGGLYGGGGGTTNTSGTVMTGGGGGGGSGLGDEHALGACSSAYVTIRWDGTPSILPTGVLLVEGDTTTTLGVLPVRLAAPLDVPVSIDWATADLPDQPSYAQLGSDVIASSGTLTFAPGQTVANVVIAVPPDDVDEPDVLWGEWGVVLFSNPTGGAVIDTSGFFGAGLFIIVDDD